MVSSISPSTTTPHCAPCAWGATSPIGAMSMKTTWWSLACESQPLTPLKVISAWGRVVMVLGKGDWAIQNSLEGLGVRGWGLGEGSFYAFLFVLQTPNP